MTMTAGPLTPAERRELAEQNLEILATLTPGTTAYSGRAQAAIANAILELSSYAQALVGILEPQPAPEIPGLPEGWQLTTEQSNVGKRLWGYTLTIPGRVPVSNRHRWFTSDAALVAGLEHARRIAAGMPELDNTPPQTGESS